MTEDEWLASIRPDEMLRHLGKDAGKRKWRLFNCACCRRAWHLIPEEPIRAVVEATERACERAWRKKGVEAAREAARPAWVRATWDHGPAGQAASAAYQAARTNLQASRVAANAAAGVTPGHPARAKHRKERAAQAGLLRDIFGNSFRPVAIEPAWLAWRDRAVVKMAQAAYEQRALPSGELDPARLAILADALEEAGCSITEILDHLRSPGPHVRGCWAIDLLLGKE
jgi:hypothetical protein